MGHHLVSVISTIHGNHFKTDDYPVQNLKLIIEEYKPELILVEIRPEAFDQSHYEDGPIEMTYITAVAMQRGITIKGIDWWKEEDIEKKGLPLTKQDKIKYEKEIFQFGKPEEIYKNFSFELLNSIDFQNKVLRIKSINSKWNQDPVWPKRQAWINENAYSEITKSNAQKVLIFVGAEHKAELDAYLTQFVEFENLPSFHFNKIIRKNWTSPLDHEFKAELEKSKIRLEKRLVLSRDKKTTLYLSAKLKQIKFVLDKYYP